MSTDSRPAGDPDSDLAVTTTLLRRYTIREGHWATFLEVWGRIVEVRRRHGFTVLFALIDEAGGVFTWAVQYTGDINVAAARYYADPERIALETVQDHVSDWEVTTVVPVALGGPIPPPTEPDIRTSKEEQT